jgi:hypothetical protein
MKIRYFIFLNEIKKEEVLAFQYDLFTIEIRGQGSGSAGNAKVFPHKRSCTEQSCIILFKL